MGGEGCKIHREDGELAFNVRPKLGLLLADAKVAIRIGNDGGTEKLVPPGSRHSQGGNDHGPGPVRACLGHKGIQQGRGREGEEYFVVVTTAGWAGGDGPVRHREGILSFGSRFRIPSEETGQQAVRGRGEGVDGQSPTARLRCGQGQGALADPARGTMWASPVSPARKAAYKELGTKSHRGRQEKAWSSRTAPPQRRWGEGRW